MSANEIEALLAEVGWSTAGLASEMGVSEETIRRWLAGTAEPTNAEAIYLRHIRRAGGSPIRVATWGRNTHVEVKP